MQKYVTFRLVIVSVLSFWINTNIQKGVGENLQKKNPNLEMFIGEINCYKMLSLWGSQHQKQHKMPYNEFVDIF